MVFSDDDLRKMMEGTMQARTACRKCGTPFTMEEGAGCAGNHGITDKVLVCPNCLAAYEVAVTPTELTLLDDVTARYGDRLTRIDASPSVAPDPAKAPLSSDAQPPQESKSGAEQLATMFNTMDEKGAENFATLLNQAGQGSGPSREVRLQGLAIAIGCGIALVLFFCFQHYVTMNNVGNTVVYFILKYIVPLVLAFWVIVGVIQLLIGESIVDKLKNMS